MRGTNYHAHNASINSNTLTYSRGRPVSYSRRAYHMERKHKHKHKPSTAILSSFFFLSFVLSSIPRTPLQQLQLLPLAQLLLRATDCRRPRAPRAPGEGLQLRLERLDAAERVTAPGHGLVVRRLLHQQHYRRLLVPALAVAACAVVDVWLVVGGLISRESIDCIGSNGLHQVPLIPLIPLTFVREIVVVLLLPGLRGRWRGLRRWP